MVDVPLLDATRQWECPSCHRQHVTRTAQVTSELHVCPAQKGMIVPFVEVDNNHGIDGRKVRHVVLEREDYVGAEQGVRLDDEGRAVMAVRTERADGSNDTTVFAGAATATTETR